MPISVKIEGLGDVIAFTTKVSKDLPVKADEISEIHAKEMRRTARLMLTQRLSQKRRGYGSPNITRTLEQSMLIWQMKPGTWAFKPWSRMAEIYGPLQEYGGVISGYHFLPIKGAGRLGEGVSVPGGNITIPAKHFVEDAQNSVERRSENIIKRKMDELFKG